MELILEFLTGKREGSKISLNEGSSLLNRSVPSVLETEAFALHLFHEKSCSEVVLLMDGLDYYFVENEFKGDLHHYILKPKYKHPYGYEALFYNYFGIASIDLRIISDDDIEISSFGSIDVLARKLTAQQAEYMVKYIFNESGGDLYSCFSATRFNMKYTDGGEEPRKVIEKLEKSVLLLEEALPHILNRPLTRVSRETCMQNGYQAAEIDDQGLAWLYDNLSVLSETDDTSRSHLKCNEIHYIAREVQTSVTLEHTDIYENRVIYGFLIKLKYFANEIEDELSNSSRLHVNRNSEGYISFFSMMTIWVSKSCGIEINNVRKYSDRITTLIHMLEDIIPVSVINYESPIFTQKVKSNRFYTSVFKAAVEWHRFNKIDWRSRKMLLAIKSIPLLFEYYSALKIRAELLSICGKGNIESDMDVMFNGLYRDHNITMQYEPVYWLVGHKNSNRTKYLNTEIRTFNQTEGGKGFRPSNHVNRKRVPDFVIEISGNDDLLILDAKYSSMDKAFTDRLRECGMKYIHGIHGVDGSSPVKAMILVCPSQKKAALADFNAPPYGLFGNKTVLPVLGVQGVTLNSDEVGMSAHEIGGTIKRLLDLTIDAH